MTACSVLLSLLWEPQPAHVAHVLLAHGYLLPASRVLCFPLLHGATALQQARPRTAAVPSLPSLGRGCTVCCSTHAGVRAVRLLQYTLQGLLCLELESPKKAAVVIQSYSTLLQYNLAVRLLQYTCNTIVGGVRGPAVHW